MEKYFPCTIHKVSIENLANSCYFNSTALSSGISIFGNGCDNRQGIQTEEGIEYSEIDQGPRIDKIIAVYPYRGTYIRGGNMVNLTVRQSQQYIAEGIADSGRIMVAMIDNFDEELRFKHILGWIKLNVTDIIGRKVKTIELIGNNNERLTGNVVVDASIPKIYNTGGAASAVLDCENGVQLSNKQPVCFYIAVIPQTFANGISIKISMEDGTSLTQSMDNPFSLSRNEIYTIDIINNTSNVIHYTTSDNKPVIMQGSDTFGSEIASNTYENGRGIIVCRDSIFTIGEYAFSGCSSMRRVIIPDSVTSIGNRAFFDCSNLTSITIGNGVTSIGDFAFYGCSRLTGVYIMDIAKWCEIDCNGPYSNPLYYAHNLYLNGELVTDLVIPDSVTLIGDYAFSRYSRLTSVTIPDSVTSIGSSAFSRCSSLTSVTIPDSVTLIGDDAFSCCSSLTSVTIPDSVTSIGDDAFYGCSSLTGVYIMDIAKWCEIGFSNYTSNPLYYAHNLYLKGELVTDLVIPDSVTSIGKGTFSGCSRLTSVTIPDSVTSIGEWAFASCSSLFCFTGKYASSDLRCLIVYSTIVAFAPFGLTEYTIPDSVTSIGGYSFSDCSSLTSVTIPDSVTSIKQDAFYGCSSLTSIVIPDSVTEIGEEAFYGCRSLTSINIPDSVTSIGNRAFEGCSNLTSIYCRPTIPPTLGTYALNIISSSAKIYVPMASVDAYKSATNWSEYAGKIVGYDF